MSDIIAQLSNHIRSTPGAGTPYPRAAPTDIRAAEEEMGFSLPSLLARALQEIGNGRFGPGNGGTIIGVQNGYESDFGTLPETYTQLKTDQQLLGNEWPPMLVPFCEWGCNSFSCVTHDNRIWIFDSDELQDLTYDLNAFFEKWINGDVLFTSPPRPKRPNGLRDPFTGE